jgi:hypothetical protein
MKRIIIKNLAGITTHGVDIDDPTIWLSEGQANEWWGKSGQYTIEIVDLDQDSSYQADLVRQKRAAEYPTIIECIEALLESLTENRPEKLEEIKTRRAAVKAKYPKR